MDYQQAHLIGIGGIGVSGLARILKARGVKVSGSDLENSPVIEKLRSEKFKIFIGHDADHLAGEVDLVAHTTAISKDNPELQAAKKRGLKIMTYPEALGFITQDKKLIAMAKLLQPA